MMERRSRAMYAFATGAPVTTHIRGLPRRATCGRVRMSADAAAEASTTDALFARLGHVNKNMRVKASAELAAMPPADVLPRLVAMLGLEDTVHRRAAVQTLGMIGAPAVPSVIENLRGGPNPTVRASASKALAAVAMYFPADRAAFPENALDALEAALAEDPDPVTKLATVGCITTLACDARMRAEAPEDEAGGEPSALTPAAASQAEDADTVTYPGNERAVSLLVTLLSTTTDVALGASLSGALTQVANCGSPERKAFIIDCLKEIADGPAPASSSASENEEDTAAGFNYVQEMCRSHINQLEGNDP